MHADFLREMGHLKKLSPPLKLSWFLVAFAVPHVDHVLFVYCNHVIVADIKIAHVFQDWLV